MRVEPFGLGQRDRSRRQLPQLLRAELEDRRALHEVEHGEARTRTAPSAPSAARGWSRRHSRRSLPACGGRGRSRRHCGCARGNASASSIASSTCSAAMRSTSGTAASKLVDDDDRAEIAPARRAPSRRAAAASSCRSTAASTASPKAASSVIRIDCAAASCSACASRSAAIQSGIVAGVGDDQHFRRAGDHVDADRAEHLPLGGRDIGIARPDDLGDRPDRLGAVGKRGDRLRAADPVDLRHAGEIGGDQHQRVDLAASAPARP